MALAPAAGRQSADLFVVERSGSVPGARLTLRCPTTAPVRCNGGERRPIDRQDADRRARDRPRARRIGRRRPAPSGAPRLDASSSRLTFEMGTIRVRRQLTAAGRRSPSELAKLQALRAARGQGRLRAAGASRTRTLPLERARASRSLTCRAASWRRGTGGRRGEGARSRSAGRAGPAWRRGRSRRSRPSRRRSAARARRARARSSVARSTSSRRPACAASSGVGVGRLVLVVEELDLARRVDVVVVLLDDRNGRVPRVRMFSRPSSLRSRTSVISTRSRSALQAVVGRPRRSRTRARARGTRRSSSCSAPRRCAAARSRWGGRPCPSGKSGKSVRCSPIGRL